MPAPTIYRPASRTARPLPLAGAAVAAGFPSPAEDFVEGTLDLNEHLIRRPAATFIMRVKGDSMTGAGIFPGDLLLVDRSLEARPGNIVIAALDGELTVKRLHRTDKDWFLIAENPRYPPIPIGRDPDCTIWGVVASAIHQFERR
ncbi:MAG: translesion error-prone DNA polymerase V autoproteolytic subunit [Rhodospirillales bacterium]